MSAFCSLNMRLFTFAFFICIVIVQAIQLVNLDLDEASAYNKGLLLGKFLLVVLSLLVCFFLGKNMVNDQSTRQ